MKFSYSLLLLVIFKGSFYDLKQLLTPIPVRGQLANLLNVTKSLLINRVCWRNAGLFPSPVMISSLKLAPLCGFVNNQEACLQILSCMFIPSHMQYY